MNSAAHKSLLHPDEAPSPLQHSLPTPQQRSCDTVLRETNLDAPSQRGELEKMARRRFQNPKPFKEGAFWWILCWQDEFVNGVRTRKRKRVKLAPVTMAAREAQKVAAEYVNPLNQGLEPVS